MFLEALKSQKDKTESLKINTEKVRLLIFLLRSGTVFLEMKYSVSKKSRGHSAVINFLQEVTFFSANPVQA